MLMNQLATPGLGSLMAGRWFAGSGQLILGVAGCVYFLMWVIPMMFAYYGQIDSAITGRPAPEMPPAWRGWVGGMLLVIAWLWSGITSLGLMRSASQTNTRSLQNDSENLAPMEEAGVIAQLTLMPGWERRGPAIMREFQFKDFPEAIKFVNAVADAAEQAWHHPDIDIRWNKVKITLTTHDAGGVTGKDFALARTLDILAKPA